MSTRVLSSCGVALVLIGAGLLPTGCQHALVQQSVVSRYSNDSDEAQMDFWHELNDVPIATNDDGLHAVLLYLDSKDPNADYAARLSVMKSRQLLPKDFNQLANQALERGTLAVILTHALHIKGGLMLHVAPFVPRYAVRELYYEDIYPLSTAQQTFSGREGRRLSAR
jgi:hypothetical protein